MSDFEPKIVGFLCNWCSYAGADLAGVSRFQYPSSLRIVRVMCTGRLDPYLLLEAFRKGIDGVFIGGCHPGDCHYLKGNYHAELKIKLTKKLLDKTDFGSKRLKLEWVAASEGQRFSEIIKEFTNQIQELGPNPIAGPNPDHNILRQITAAIDAVRDFRLRAIIAKEFKIVVEEGNIYGEFKSQEDWDTFLDDAIEMEYELKQILGLTKNNPLSVKDIAAKIDLPTDKTLEQIVYLRGKNLIALESIAGFTPQYRAVSLGGN